MFFGKPRLPVRRECWFFHSFSGRCLLLELPWRICTRMGFNWKTVPQTSSTRFGVLGLCLAAAAGMSFAAERAGSFPSLSYFTLALWISSPWGGVLANLKKIDNGCYRWLMEPFWIPRTSVVLDRFLYGQIHQILMMFLFARSSAKIGIRMVQCCLVVSNKLHL